MEWYGEMAENKMGNWGYNPYKWSYNPTFD